MPKITKRNLEVLKLDEPLRQYAETLTGDANVSSGLVHGALLAAFSAPPSLKPSAGLEASLRSHIDLNAEHLRAKVAAVPTISAQAPIPRQERP
jgi:hypothetical protein